LLKIISLPPLEFGRPNASIFRSRGVPGRLDALLAKSLLITTGSPPSNNLSIILGDEEYLILGCDGLWDTIQPPNVIEMVQEHLAGGGARSQLAKFLVERAIAHGSTDNITVVVVFLDCHRTEKDPETSMDVGEVEGTGDEKVPETPTAEGAAKETGDEKAPETAAAEGATKETGDEKAVPVP
jgi:hypothetical protein